MAKLSPKMTKVMEYLTNAVYSYEDEKIDHINKGIDELYTEKGKSDFFTAKIYKYNGQFLIGLLGHSATLKALEKRGLINIIKLGGDNVDFVEVVGMELEPPLSKLKKVYIEAPYYSDYCKDWLKDDRIVYTSLELTKLNEILDKEKKDGRKYTLKLIDTIEPTVYEFK